MTHDERITYLKRLDKETISPTELARVIDGNPYVYNVAAKEGLLTLPYIWRGRNLRIFKEPLLRLLESYDVNPITGFVD